MTVLFQKHFPKIVGCRSLDGKNECDLELGVRSVFLDKPLTSGIFEMVVSVSEPDCHYRQCSIGAALVTEAPSFFAGQLLGCISGLRSAAFVTNNWYRSVGEEHGAVWVDGSQRMPRAENGWTVAGDRYYPFTHYCPFTLEVDMNRRTMHFFEGESQLACRIVAVPSPVLAGFSSEEGNTLHIYAFLRRTTSRAQDLPPQRDVVWDKEAMKSWCREKR